MPKSLIATVSFMYVLAANATSIDVLSLNAPGQAQQVQKLDIAGPARAVGLKIGQCSLPTHICESHT